MRPTKENAKKQWYVYPATLSFYEDEISINFPDLNVGISRNNLDDAFMDARELLGKTLFELEQARKPIPEPADIGKTEFDPDESIAYIDVFMPAVRMANVNRSVNRTVTLPAWLNYAALERNVNFSQVLQKALKEMLGVSEPDWYEYGYDEDDEDY